MSDAGRASRRDASSGAMESRPQGGDRVELTVGRDWTAALRRSPDGVMLRVGQPNRERALEITISLTEDGPVLRARAAALELESEGDILATCREFRLEAREGVSIVSPGTIAVEGRRLDLVATHGSARIKANDDVQLLGENVLLNCDRTVSASMPDWAFSAPRPAPKVQAATVSGDVDLANELDARKMGEER